MVARAFGETSGMICSRTSPWVTEPALDLATGCTRGVAETLVRVAGAAAGVIGECLSLAFSNEGDACEGRGEDADEECSVEGAGFGADLVYRRRRGWLDGGGLLGGSAVMEQSRTEKNRRQREGGNNA